LKPVVKSRMLVPVRDCVPHATSTSENVDHANWNKAAKGLLVLHDIGPAHKDYEIYWPKNYGYTLRKPRLNHHYKLLVEFANRVIDNHDEDEIKLYKRLVLCWNCHKLAKGLWIKTRCNQTGICPSCNSFDLNKRARQTHMDRIIVDDTTTWFDVTLDVEHEGVSLISQYITFNRYWLRLRINLTRKCGAMEQIVKRGFLAIDFKESNHVPMRVHGHLLVQVDIERREKFEEWIKEYWEKQSGMPIRFCKEVKPKGGNGYTTAMRKVHDYMNHVWNVSNLQTIIEIRKMTKNRDLYRAFGTKMKEVCA